MNYGDKVLDDIAGLIQLFSPQCTDRTTLDEIHAMIGSRDSWKQAHDLFRQIREKTLKALRTEGRRSECQYMFEEICAKTIYKVSGESAPFDADSPYWIHQCHFICAALRQNKGAPGIDGMAVDELPDYIRHHWPEIRTELEAGHYRP